ncbi:MAG: DUF58 domain-containing protein [Candidatus Hydrogenedentes bacterium]|nr:DUF58 domain-containing protein [Candidatus Hydrogenedentota bacterium]
MSEKFRKNALWFVLALAALGVAFLAQAPYMAFAVYAFLLLVFLAHFSSVAWLSGLDCTRTISQTTLRQGEDAQVEVTLTNRRGWPIPWIFIEDLAPADFPRMGDTTRLAVLMPGRSITLRYTLTCPRRGYHRIGPLLMESGDLFGLQKRFRTGQQQDYISVLPTVAYIDTFNIGARRPQGPVRISNRVYEDPTRISGLREYVRGDPLNRIHWKASARTGELYVKQSEPSNVLGATLILDLFGAWYQGEDGPERMELAITAAASFAYLLQSSGEQVGLLTNARDAAEVARYDVEARESLSRKEAEGNIVGEDISDRLNPLTVPTRRSPVQAMLIVENLARVLPTDGLDVGQLILSEFRRLPHDAALLPIVPQVTEDLALLLGQMKLSGFAVTAFLIKNPASYQKAASLLMTHEINLIHIEHERQLHEISPARIGR